MKKMLMIVGLVLSLFALAAAQTGVKKRRPRPEEYGRVVIDNFSEKAGMSPVVFDHWVHRQNFTCRVCHVDVGFAMKADDTGITAADNMKGYYCGTCHNGNMTFEGRKVFNSCAKIASAADSKTCDRCHSQGKNVRKEHDFAKFVAKLPKERLGNGINWEKADEEGLIRPADYIEGVSIKRKALKVQKDFALDPKVQGMPEIIFSHKKHTVWNGCELCHPEIFVGVKKGTTKYSMIEIFQGKYCGVCHTTVAFPLQDCQRCHTKSV